MTTDENGTICWLRLTNALFCPELDMSFISTAALDANKILITTEKGICYIFNDTVTTEKKNVQRTVGMAILREDGLYRVKEKLPLTSAKSGLCATCVQNAKKTARKKFVETVDDDQLNQFKTIEEEKLVFIKEDLDCKKKV